MAPPRTRCEVLSDTAFPIDGWTPPPPLPSLAVLGQRFGSEYQAAEMVYSGPTAQSNWVLPGVLLAGGAPHDFLRELVRGAGVTTFLSLQARGEADSYQKAARKLGKVRFLEHHIVDRQVTSDAQLAALVQLVLRRLAEPGEVVYVHCKGGHGRTGTLVSVLLGLIYGLDGPTALATWQALHDTRRRPCFAAKDYAPSEDGRSCVALFEVQRAQVIRLLQRCGGAVEAAEAAAETAPASAGATPTTPTAQKQLSLEYGLGASRYAPGTLEEWAERGREAAAAVQRRDWAEAARLFGRCAELRPDWQKGHDCLKRARERQEAAERGARAVEHSAPAATAASRDRPSALPKDAPRLVMLVGPPGAGKSTFARALAASDASWEVISSDELGGRAVVEEALGRLGSLVARGAPVASRGGERVARPRLILDRCNVTVAERRHMLDLSMVEPRDAIAVYFATDAALCAERVASRTDHPTIPYGCGRAAVASMSRDLQPPAESEGFRAVRIVRSADECDALLRALGAAAAAPSAPGFFKFPRTRHLLNTGGTAVTRDDLVLEPAEARTFYDGEAVVLAEEKVDGANLGFSLSRDYEVLVQNRSHHVTCESAAQFRPLAGWLDEHRWALCQLLEVEDEVLFGEWLAARHSVAYSRLPAYFIAFDIYNKRTGRFCSAAERDRRLDGLGIPVVRTVARRAFRSADELLALLESDSAYADAKVEGVYLRIDDEASRVNLRRAKLVRPDFIQGIGAHWSTAEVVKNGIRPDLWADVGEGPDRTV